MNDKTSLIIAIAAGLLAVPGPARADIACDGVWGDSARRVCDCGEFVDSDRRLECFDEALIGLNDDGTLCVTFCDIDGDGIQTASDLLKRSFASMREGTCAGEWVASCSAGRSRSVLAHFSACLGENALPERIECMDAARLKVIEQMVDLGRMIDDLLVFQEGREAIVETAESESGPIDCRDAYHAVLDQCSVDDVRELCTPLMETAAASAKRSAAQLCEEWYFSQE